MTRDELIELSKEVAIVNQKWTHDPETGEKKHNPLGLCLILICSEVCEAMEGERKDLWDTHLKHRKMAEAEMADTMIRLLDLCNRFDVEIEEDFMQWGYGFDEETKAENLYEIIRNVDRIYTYTFLRKLCNDDVTIAMESVVAYCKKWGYDLRGAIREKMEYNKHREDHKLEARQAANGKKW